MVGSRCASGMGLGNSLAATIMPVSLSFNNQVSPAIPLPRSLTAWYVPCVRPGCQAVSPAAGPGTHLSGTANTMRSSGPTLFTSSFFVLCRALTPPPCWSSFPIGTVQQLPILAASCP